MEVSDVKFYYTDIQKNTYYIYADLVPSSLRIFLHILKQYIFY